MIRILKRIQTKNKSYWIKICNRGLQSYNEVFQPNRGISQAGCEAVIRLWEPVATVSLYDSTTWLKHSPNRLNYSILRFKEDYYNY